MLFMIKSGGRVMIYRIITSLRSLGELMLLLVAVCFLFSSSFAFADDALSLPPFADTAVPDLFTGSMSFRIPIEVPPGINGLKPDLELYYRSSNDFGWLGQGWDLEVGTIERSTKTGTADYATD